jgi:hypothetical protein
VAVPQLAAAHSRLEQLVAVSRIESIESS